MDIKLSCGITGSMDSEIKKEMKTIVNHYSAHAAPEFLPSTANSVLLGDPVVCIHPSIGAIMSSEQQARKMLTSTATTTGDFEYAGEYHSAMCLSFWNRSFYAKQSFAPAQ